MDSEGDNEDKKGRKWFRCYGLEDWTFCEDGRMEKRYVGFLLPYCHTYCLTPVMRYRRGKGTREGHWTGRALENGMGRRFEVTEADEMTDR